jgi:hypothetical protein
MLEEDFNRKKLFVFRLHADNRTAMALLRPLWDQYQNVLPEKEYWQWYSRRMGSSG